MEGIKECFYFHNFFDGENEVVFIKTYPVPGDAFWFVEEVTVWGVGSCWAGWVGWLATAGGGEGDHGFGSGDVFSVPCWGFVLGSEPVPVP